MNRKPMKGLKLSAFGGVQPASEAEPEVTQPEAEPAPLEEEEAETPAAPKARVKRKKAEKLTNVNIKISRNQQRWLQDTAQKVRDNNLEPVPPDQRLYPAHLIGVAIDLLKAQGIDWDEVRNAEDLRNRLNL